MFLHFGIHSPTTTRCVLHAWRSHMIKASKPYVLAATEESEYLKCCFPTADLNQHLVAERFLVVDGYVAVTLVRASASSWTTRRARNSRWRDWASNLTSVGL